jgi:hypothetical protein
LPTLQYLLDEELRRYRGFRQQAEKEHWQGKSRSEAQTVYTNRYQQAFTAIKAPETTALMISNLLDEHFGGTAALVLKVQWILANEPKEDGHFLGSVDFSRVEEMRDLRARNPEATSAEAEAIFRAVATLIAGNATESQKGHTSKLAIQAVRLPHGQRVGTIDSLLSTMPQAAQAALVQNLVLSGKTIPFDVVQKGIDEVFEDAKTRTWILGREGWELKAWLLLLPFTDHPAQLTGLIAALPPRQREPRFLEEMIRATKSVQSSEVEEVLFKLAENDAAFYANHEWCKAVLLRDTPTSARRYLELVMEGKIGARDGWHALRDITGLLNKHPELRNYVYRLLKEGTSPRA